MSTKENPLGGRGRAEEERWAQQQNREAIEKLKQKDKAGATDPAAPVAPASPAPTKLARTPCKNHATTAPADCCCNQK